MARPKNNDLPRNLTFEPDSGRYRWRNPITKQRQWRGKDKIKAIEWAERANAIIEIEKEKQKENNSKPVTAEYVLNKYIADVVPGKPWDESTMKNRIGTLRLYIREWGDMPFFSIDRVFLADWIEPRCQTGDRRNKHRTIMGDVWTYAISRKLADFNEPLAMMKWSTSNKLQANKRKKERLTIEAFKQIRSHGSHMLQCAMDLSLVTLQARQEIVNINRKTDIKDGHIFVIRDKTASRSEMAFISIPITDQIQEILDRCYEDNIASPYPIHMRPRSMRPQHLQNKPHWTYVMPDFLTKEFGKARKLSGLYDNHSPETIPGFHEIRSLGGRLYKDMGKSSEFIRGLMAHSDKKTTDIYLENPGELRPEHFKKVTADMDLKSVLGA